MDSLFSAGNFTGRDIYFHVLGLKVHLEPGDFVAADGRVVSMRLRVG